MRSSKNAIRKFFTTYDAEGIDVRELHADVRRNLGAGEDRLWEGILVTPRVRKIIVLAESYAGDAHVEPVASAARAAF